MRPVGSGVAARGHSATRVLICFIALVMAGLSLAGYLRFATIYSALYGTSSEAARVATAKLWGLLCLWSLPVLELVSVGAFAGLIRLQNADLSPLMKTFARYGTALLFSVGGTLLVLLALYELARTVGY